MTSDTRWTRPEPLYPAVITVLDALLRIVCRVRVGGHPLPRTGPVVAANHVHQLDAVVLASVAHWQGRRIRFLALANLWDIPGLGWVLRKGRMIPVHRGHGPERMVADARRALGAGQAVLIYPEGRLPRGDAHPDARPGTGLLALTADAPVVPMAMWGLGAIGSTGRLRRRLGVVIGVPIDLARWDGRTDPAAAHEAADAILAAVRAVLPRAEALARDRPFTSRGGTSPPPSG